MNVEDPIYFIREGSEVTDVEKDPFKEYLRESEPDKAYKDYAWSTAIGL